jgi:hypothetical protein
MFYVPVLAAKYWPAPNDWEILRLAAWETVQ